MYEACEKRSIAVGHTHICMLHERHMGRHECDCGYHWVTFDEAKEVSKVTTVQENIAAGNKIAMIKAIRDYASAMYGGLREFPISISLKQRAENALKCEQELIKFGFDLDDVRQWFMGQVDAWLISRNKYNLSDAFIGLRDAKDFVEAYGATYAIRGVHIKGQDEWLMEAGHNTLESAYKALLERLPIMPDERVTYEIYCESTPGISLITLEFGAKA